MAKHCEDDCVVLEQDGEVHDPNDLARRRPAGRRLGQGGRLF